MEEEEALAWQDVLDEILAGRKGNLACPFCRHVPLEVSEAASGGTRVACRQCGKFIEGRFGWS